MLQREDGIYPSHRTGSVTDLDLSAGAATRIVQLSLATDKARQSGGEWNVGRETILAS